MRLFWGFVLISGVGWLFDFISYSIITQVFDVSPSFANVASSMVGVTYVWVVALNRIFDRQGFERSIYLPIYWGYQSFSILSYSVLISIVAGSLFNNEVSLISRLPSEIVAKILLTAPNLLTNFIFMKFLTKFMNPISQR